MTPSYFVVEFIDGTHLFASNSNDMSLAEVVEAMKEHRPTIRIELRDSFETIDIDYSHIYRVHKFVEGYAPPFVSTTIQENRTRFDLTDGTVRYLGGKYTLDDVREGTVPAWFKHSVSEIVGTAYYGHAGIYEDWYRIAPKNQVVKITLVSGRDIRAQIDTGWDSWYYNLNTARYIKLTEVDFYKEWKPTGNIFHVQTRNIETITEVER